VVLIIFVMIFGGQEISIEKALSTISLGAVFATLLNYWQLSRILASSHQTVFTKTVIIEHWKFGRLLLLSSIFAWLPANIYSFVLPLRENGLAEVGAWRALFNVVFPLQLLFANYSTYLTRTFSNDLIKDSIKQKVTKIFGVYLIIALLFSLSIIISGKYILHILYVGRYDEFGSLLPLFSFIPLTSGLHSLLGVAVKVYERTDVVLQSSIWGFFVSILLLPLIYILGVNITPISSVIAYTVMLIPFRVAISKTSAMDGS
jgi:O-antigen/teichoic acid export membrane protein